MPHSAPAFLPAGHCLQVFQMWVYLACLFSQSMDPMLCMALLLRYLKISCYSVWQSFLGWASSHSLSLIIWVGSASSYTASALHTPLVWRLRSVALLFSHYGTSYRKRKDLESLPEGWIHHCRMRSSRINDYYQILGKPIDAVMKLDGGPVLTWVLRNG